MEVVLKPQLQAQVDRWSAKTGRGADELVEDALSSYLNEVSELGDTLDKRYDEIMSGKVKGVDPETAFAELKKRLR